MHARWIRTISLAAGLTIMGSPAAAQLPASVDLRGTVRDFRRSHVDMNVVPIGGTGHYAGNVSMSLTAGSRPAFIGSGARVWNEWRDLTGDPIAPHLFMPGGEPSPGASGGTDIPVTYAGNEPRHGVFDSWDSSAGPYGGDNVGPEPDYAPGSPMDEIALPAELTGLASMGDVTYSDDVTFGTNLRFDSLTIRQTLTVVGHVEVLCETFHLHTHARIELDPDSSLRLYTMNGGSSWNHVEVNVNTGQPGLVEIYNLGTTELMVHNHAQVYARFVSPHARLHITNHGEVFGTFRGETMEFGNHGDFHLDTALDGPSGPVDSCGNFINDSEGSFAGAGSGGIFSPASFGQWYQTSFGVNMATRHTITLTNNGSGVYELHNDAFYPIDNRLYGNEGDDHNNHFTYTLAAFFEYSQCAGQFFEFEGADDCWVYINGELAMDLGGVLPGTSQMIPVDRLGLTDGNVYQLHFFYAQRNGLQAPFHIRTNLFLSNDLLAGSSTGVFD